MGQFLKKDEVIVFVRDAKGKIIHPPDDFDELAELATVAIVTRVGEDYAEALDIEGCQRHSGIIRISREDYCKIGFL